MRNLIGCLMVLMTGLAIGQSLEGTVSDALTGETLPGAAVLVNGEKGMSADENGYFRIDGLVPGRARIEVSFVGFTTSVYADVWVKAGKSTRLDVSLSPSPIELEQIQVRVQNPMIEPGKRTINEEQINRFAASYYDPARLMTSAPDVAVTNDQNNQISVRGLSPNYNSWQLEGLEIVNPNHLSNAGTFSDQPAGTSGGVNILSAQMLDQSSFYYGAFSNRQNNSIGGIMDMYLRPGVASNAQFTAQASLIGLDFSAEGPFTEGGTASYLANYRYSFTGLLTTMGVNFGGESIGFQDLSFNVNMPMKNGGTVKVFGVGGTSFNRFDHLAYVDSEREKDRKDIYFKGEMGMTGINLKKGGLNVTFGASGFGNDRQEITYTALDEVDSDTTVVRDRSMYSSRISYTWKVANGTLEAGAVNNMHSFSGVEGLLFSGQYYVTTAQHLSTKVLTEGGITYHQTQGDYSIDPRVQLTYSINDRNSVYASAAKVSQLLNPYNYYFVSDAGNTNTYAVKNTYHYIKSYRYITGYSLAAAKYTWDTELFYYHFPEVLVLLDQEATTKAATYGVTSTVSTQFSGNWYALVGGSIFNSSFDKEINNPFNTRYNLSASGGREYVREKRDAIRSFGLNARLTWQGGAFYTDTNSEAFASQYADYIRGDIRIQFTKSKEKYTRIWAIDIQNVTGRQNEGFYFYDTFTMQQTMSYQLGLIPILTYRLEF